MELKRTEHDSLATKTALTTLDVKTLTEDGTFEGYCSVFNVVDQGGDMIAPGAFKKSLKARPAAKVRLLYQHRWAEPIGVWEELKEDEKGLFGRARLLMEVQQGKEAHALIRAGALDGLSIGFRTIKSENGRQEDPYDRKLTELDLWEVSTVTFPMNVQSTITGVKGADPGLMLNALVDVGIPQDFAIDILRHGVDRAKELLLVKQYGIDPKQANDVLGNLARISQIMKG